MGEDPVADAAAPGHRLPHEVMVFVRRGDEYLVLHRSPHREAYWHVVAGALEPGETPAEAAAREVREEVGLDAAGAVALGRRYVYALAEESAAVRARFAPDAREVTVDSFLVDAPPGWEPSLNWEHDVYCWCRPDEAERLLFWREPRELLREIVRAPSRGALPTRCMPSEPRSEGHERLPPCGS